MCSYHKIIIFIAKWCYMLTADQMLADEMPQTRGKASKLLKYPTKLALNIL